MDNLFKVSKYCPFLRVGGKIIEGSSAVHLISPVKWVQLHAVFADKKRLGWINGL